LAVDLASGAVTVISDAQTGLGPDLASPVGVAYDAANRRAFVVDAGMGAVVVIEPESGDRVILSK
ncbi:MAG: hypothetical protein ACYTDU_12490, partial [Planctomycetota bacterium]